MSMQERPCRHRAWPSSRPCPCRSPAAQPPAGRGGRGRPWPGPPPAVAGQPRDGAAASRGHRYGGGCRHGGRCRHRTAGAARPGHAERDRGRRFAHGDDRRRRALRVHRACGRTLHPERLEDRACRHHLRADPAGPPRHTDPAHRRAEVRGEPPAPARQRDHRAPWSTNTAKPTPGRRCASCATSCRPAAARCSSRQRLDRRSRHLPCLRSAARRLHRLGGAAQRRTWRGRGAAAGRARRGARARSRRRLADAAAARELATRAGMLQGQLRRGGAGDRLRPRVFPWHGQHRAGWPSR